jgi:hypothetical protein
VQFSTAIALRSEEERSWAEQAVELLARYDEGEIEVDDEGRVPEGIDPDRILPECEYLGFQAEVEEAGLWIYAEEVGTPEFVVPLVQAYLRRFDPQGCHGFEWANTCSKMRIDEFGGGAVFITADEARWMASNRSVAEQIAAHNAGKTGGVGLATAG